MNRSSVSIIILNWNGYDVTRECLESLYQIDHDNYHIVLVDNGSHDGSVEKIRAEFGDLKLDILDLKKNLGFTGGNNEGIVFAKEKYNSDYYLLLNNDTTVEPNFLTEMLKTFDNNPKCYAVVPKIYFSHAPNVIWFAGGKISPVTGIVKHYGIDQQDTGKYDEGKTIEYMNGCCALISSASIESVGVLDNIFFANTEDVDYSMRIIKSGHTIEYNPKAVIYHKFNHTFKSNRGKWLAFYLTARNKILLQKKHYSSMKLPVFYLVFGVRWVLYLTVKLTISGDHKSVKAIYWGVNDGIRNRLRFVG
ncbi:glycosyltransferase family 2 protein [Dyadobacter alkalitolerans]|uniref:glycosyltransferase family 2 protein n=1 Tax=Dyadobacter alkalitolerans TaxID=492736 RepID=UPI000424D14A|nr:glycosyltransferase family 2 protein [Dyadobacter alkalitolerans]